MFKTIMTKVSGCHNQPFQLSTNRDDKNQIEVEMATMSAVKKRSKIAAI